MKIALDAFFASFVRTFVPMVVGWLLSLLVTLNVTLDPQFEITLNGLITVIFQGAYYGIIRLLELHVSPIFGKLLGSSQRPMLYAKATDGGSPVITDLVETGATKTVVEISSSKV